MFGVFQEELRQEIDGPRLSSWSLSPVDRYSKMKIIAGAKEELSPAQKKDRETTYFSFSRLRRPSRLHTCRKAPRGAKREGAPPHSR